jgi:hypothetical protein
VHGTRERQARACASVPQLQHRHHLNGSCCHLLNQELVCASTCSLDLLQRATFGIQQLPIHHSFGPCADNSSTFVHGCGNALSVKLDQPEVKLEAVQQLCATLGALVNEPAGLVCPCDAVAQQEHRLTTMASEEVLDAPAAPTIAGTLSDEARVQLTKESTAQYQAALHAREAMTAADRTQLDSLAASLRPHFLCNQCGGLLVEPWLVKDCGHHYCFHCLHAMVYEKKVSSQAAQK